MKMIDADALKSKIEKIQVMAFGLRCGKTLLMSALEEYRNDVIRAIEDSPSVDGWISVKDRLPDEHGEMSLYLVCVEGTEYPFRAFFDGRNWGDGISKVDVKYWMPLPEPPKEVDDDQ